MAGLCLLSPAVMRLRHSEQTNLYADFLLSQRCLYIMKYELINSIYSVYLIDDKHISIVIFFRDVARYDFTHEILQNDLSHFRGHHVPRTRRISLINRSQPISQ